MVSKAETDKFVTDEKQNLSSESRNCHSKWWKQGYRSQHVISRFIESNYFRALVIILVVVDTSLVITEIILDSLKIHYECETNLPHLSKHRIEVTKERLELAMEVAHYASIAILTFFLFELFVRIYALGREFWNIRRKKMEYFDAFIVITSLIIDLSFLRGEEKILGEKLMFILSFRLWRFVRIISSVAEGIRHGDSKHKQNLNQQYLTAVHRLIDLLIHKTSYAENKKEDLTSVLEHFRSIDRQCQSAAETLNQTHKLTSSLIVAQFVEEINGLENTSDGSVIAAMFFKDTESTNAV